MIGLVKKDAPQRLILSQQAKAIITEALQSNKYADRDDKLEPPYMAPSPDPGDYSRVRDVSMGLMHRWC
jgi:hypothetical protein